MRLAFYAHCEVLHVGHWLNIIYLSSKGVVVVADDFVEAEQRLVADQAACDKEWEIAIFGFVSQIACSTTYTSPKFTIKYSNESLFSLE